MKGVADSIALIQRTNHDLSMDRRGKILNAQLNKKYRKLGSAKVPITDMLFGNDLAAKPTVTTLPPQPKPISKGTIPTRPFEAGRLRKFVKKWEEITSNPFILNMVCGADIPIDEISDLQSKNQTCLKNQVQGTLRKEIDTETEKLLSMGVIEKINASER